MGAQWVLRGRDSGARHSLLPFYPTVPAWVKHQLLLWDMLEEKMWWEQHSLLSRPLQEVCLHGPTNPKLLYPKLCPIPSQTALKSSKVRPKTLWIPSLNSPALRSYKDFSSVVFFLTTVYLIPFSWLTCFSGNLLGNWWLIILEFPLKSETDMLSVQFRPFPQTPLHSLRRVELPHGIPVSTWSDVPCIFSDMKFSFFRLSNEDFF